MSGARDGEAARPMTDERLERELRAILRGRHPGPAPLTLRERVLDVPDTDRGHDSRRSVASGARPLLAMAAAIALLVAGASAVALLTGPALHGPAASPVSTAPTSSFDPTLVGPGIVSASPTPWLPLIVVLAVVALLILALALRGWRRLVPLAGVVGCLGFAAYATQVPVEVGTFGYGPGLNVVEASMPPGADTTVFYETAQPGQPFSFPLYLTVRAPVPVRIDGLYQATTGVNGFPQLSALWTDAAPNLGSVGPARPFQPVEVSDWFRALWVVGRAGACADGRAVDPANPPTDLGYTAIESVTLQASVLGWPRTVEVPLPFRLVEFITDPCAPDIRATPPAPPASIPVISGSPTG